MKKTKRITVIVIILAFSFTLFTYSSTTVKAGTPISGNITIDTTWTLANAPYWVEDNITVNPGVNLTVEPGVVIKFNGQYRLDVEGNLTAVGSPSNMITFTSNKTLPNVDDWSMINIRFDGFAHIEYCEISYAIRGVKLTSSSNNIVANNTITNNTIGIDVDSTSAHNIVIHNKVYSNEQRGIRLIVSSNTTVAMNDIISNPVKGIFVFIASNNEILLNNVSGSNEGISIWSSSENNTIKKNSIFSNNYSIWIFNSRNNAVLNNSILFSTEGGILIDFSDGTLVTGNNISFNTPYGINTQISSNVKIYHNNFYGTPPLAQDDTADTIYNETYVNGGGNYWSGYSGDDDFSGPNHDIPGSDGIGDSIYSIDGNSKDYYPLMNPIGTPLPDTTPPSITDVIAQPDPQEVHDYVNISANVTDNVEIFNVWTHIKKPDSSTLTNISMNYDSTNERYYRNISYSLLGTFTFYIWANDTSDNWNGTSGQFTIEDNANPIANAGVDRQVEQGTTLAFNGSASWDNFEINNYTWEFVDNTTIYLYGVNPLYTFENLGNFEVILTVKDTSGHADKDTVWINVTQNLPPSIPANLTVTTPSERGELILTWDANSESDLAGYNVFRSPNPDGPYDKINADLVTATTYTDSGLEDGKTYYYKITAVDSADNESPQSDWKSGTTQVVSKPPKDDIGWLLWLLLIIIIALIAIIIFFWWKRRKRDTGQD